MFNIVTERENFPAAVLIRAVEIDGVSKLRTNGPGKLTRALHIDRAFNTWDLTRGEKLWFEFGQPLRHETITTMKRVGVAYAKHCVDYPWRFVLQDT